MNNSTNLNSKNPHPRKQQASISSTVVRCICITASCIVTACGLLGLGVTCFIIRLMDPLAAPCPFFMTIIVFAVAGLLFAVSFVFLLIICVRRNKMRRKASLDELPVACVVEEERKPEEVEHEDEEEQEDQALQTPDPANPVEAHASGDNFEMAAQRSADVSLWIELQKPSESAVDCYPLENRDGATSHDTDCEGSESEITPL